MFLQPPVQLRKTGIKIKTKIVSYILIFKKICVSIKQKFGEDL